MAAAATPLRIIEGSMDKDKALAAALSQIDRAFGKGSVMKLGDKGKIVEIESVSTGSLGLDLALGIGGLPKGRIVEIYGPESSGKTTLALHVVAEVQKAGGTAAFIDAEHALDPSYAHKLGVNLDDLALVAQLHHRAFSEGPVDLRQRRFQRALLVPVVASHEPQCRLCHPIPPLYL